MRFEDDEDYKNDDIIELPILKKVKVKVGKIMKLQLEDYETPLTPRPTEMEAEHKSRVIGWKRF